MDAAPPVDARGAVRLLRVGICGTDFQMIRGERHAEARILGHEGIGVTEGHVSRRVVFNPVDAADQDVVLGHSYDGLLQTRYVLGSSCAQPELVDVPETLPLEIAALCEPVGACLYSWEILESSLAPRRVAIWGAGPIGLTQALIARDRGVKSTVYHPSERRLEWATTMFDSRTEFASASAASRYPVDAAIIATTRTGAASALCSAVEQVRPGGVVILVAAVNENGVNEMLPGVSLAEVRRANVRGSASPTLLPTKTRDGKRLLIGGHRGTARRHLTGGYAFLANHVDFFQRLNTHVVDPADAVKLINRRCAGLSYDDRGDEIVKIIVDFDRRGSNEVITSRP